MTGAARHRVLVRFERKSVIRTAYAVLIAGSLLGAGPVLAADPDWSRVDQALGKAGADQPGDVHKYALPRSDLHVALDGVAIKPALALGGWLAFKRMDGGAMVMGDLVLTESEINRVMSKLLASGITVTAVHNHLLRAQPATFYLHVAGEGETRSSSQPHSTTRSGQARHPLAPQALPLRPR